MIKHGRRLICWTLTPLLVLTLFAVPGSASEAAKQHTRQYARITALAEEAPNDSAEDLWATILLLREKQQFLEERIAAAKEQIDGVATEKSLLDQQISLGYQELTCFDQLMAIYEDQLSTYQQKQEELDQSIDECRAKLAVRLRQTHEEGLPGLLELLASSSDLMSLLIAAERQSQLTDYDDRLMEELNRLYYQYNDLSKDSERIKAARHQIALEQAERTRVFNERLQICGGFLWNLEHDVHRFSYFVQQSQAGEQYVDVTVQNAIDAFVASLDDQMWAELEEKRQEKLALYTDYIKGQMEEGLLQQGGEFYLSGSKYILPLALTGNRTPAITSAMGYCTYQIGDTVISDYHRGIDLSADYGTSVAASASGVVVFTGWQNGYGNYVVVWHEDGSQTRYAHLSEITVSVGDYLLQGEELGLVGSSGNSKGIGCHFELWKDGKRVDPTPFLVFSSVE